jgi:hypothetical protein
MSMRAARARILLLDPNAVVCFAQENRSMITVRAGRANAAASVLIGKRAVGVKEPRNRGSWLNRGIFRTVAPTPVSDRAANACGGHRQGDALLARKMRISFPRAQADREWRDKCWRLYT